MRTRYPTAFQKAASKSAIVPGSGMGATVTLGEELAGAEPAIVGSKMNVPAGTTGHYRCGGGDSSAGKES